MRQANKDYILFSYRFTILKRPEGFELLLSAFYLHRYRPWLFLW
jgi:hypothetical protein